jgi:hypothetical protein
LHSPSKALGLVAVTSRVEVGVVAEKDREAARHRCRLEQELANVKWLAVVPGPLAARHPTAREWLVHPPRGIGPGLEIREFMRIMQAQDIGLAAGIQVRLVGDRPRRIDALEQTSSTATAGWLTTLTGCHKP